MRIRGRIIRQGERMTSNDFCENCEKPAVAEIIGETDSFGSEYMLLCQNCLERALGEDDMYLDAEDVEDRHPAVGKRFLVNETTNYETSYDWKRYFTSYREATRYYREIERKAEQYGGLYPDNGIQEV